MRKKVYKTLKYNSYVPHHVLFFFKGKRKKDMANFKSSDNIRNIINSTGSSGSRVNKRPGNPVYSPGSVYSKKGKKSPLKGMT